MNKTYHLTYVTTDNELHTYIASSEKSLDQGWHRIRTTVDRYALPVYMLIKTEDSKVYYIPQSELFSRYNLGNCDLLVFLHECYESRLISLELYNMLNYCERYKGKLTDQEKDILNNLSIRFWQYEIDEYGFIYYKVEL